MLSPQTEKTVVESNYLNANSLGRELVFCEPTPCFAEPPPQGLVMRQTCQRICKRWRVVDRNKKRIDVLSRNLAAARHIGRDNGPSASGSFQQTFW